MKYQNTHNSNKVTCTICPRNCTLADGQSGFCYVRKNIGGEISLISYGFNTGLSVDPVEKKPLYHFYPGSRVLSFGGVGCNLGCKFCQNWRSSHTKIDPETLSTSSPYEIAKIADLYECKSVAYTYNEPITFFEYAIDTAQACREKGIKNIAVTAGYINEEPRIEFFNFMDAVNIDLKAFSDSFYKKNCLTSLAPVLETIKYVKNETDCWLELTTLLIEGENDSEEEIRQECEWILENLGSEVPIHFSAFHPCYKFTNHNPTSVQTLMKAYTIAKDTGLRYVYTGNIINKETSSTYCHNCQSDLIVRNGYLIEEYNLDDNGRCMVCSTPCSGHF